MEEKINQLFEEYEKIAKEKGIKLNPDKEVLTSLFKSLLEKEKEFGKRYCPCRVLTGNAEEDEKIICPCIYLEEEIKKDGRCHCVLFVK